MTGVITSLLQEPRGSKTVFPYTIKSWKNHDEKAEIKPSIDSTNNFIPPPGKSLFEVSERFEINLPTKIRVDDISDLREHRFNYNINCKNSACRCRLDDETPAPAYFTLWKQCIYFMVAMYLLYGSNVFTLW